MSERNKDIELLLVAAEEGRTITSEIAAAIRRVVTSAEVKPSIEVDKTVKGWCVEGPKCVCGGDVPAVRAGCCNWRALT